MEKNETSKDKKMENLDESQSNVISIFLYFIHTLSIAEKIIITRKYKF